MRGGQWTKGKALDTFAPMGPFIVTSDEIGDPHNLAIKLELNGEIMQDSCTDKLIFKVPQIISFLSELFTLEPGDIIATGTPAGVGPLEDGDLVKIQIDNVGVMELPVKRR